MSHDGPVRLGKGKVLAKTERALLVKMKDHGERWIPKSCFHDESEVWSDETTEGQVVVREWWARKNKIV